MFLVIVGSHNSATGEGGTVVMLVLILLSNMTGVATQFCEEFSPSRSDSSLWKQNDAKRFISS